MAEIDELVINVRVNGDTKELENIAKAIQKTGTSAKKSKKEVEPLNKTIKKTGDDAKTAGDKMKAFKQTMKSIVAGISFAKTMSFLGKAVNKSMEYTESMNLFTVAMGDYAEEAQKYAESVSEIMGIDPAQWLKAQGTFNILATGFGVTADKAAIMSKNLTQLGYDLSSFYNMSVDDAMLKLQSGLAGELEPLRRIGYDLSVARLQQEAYALGIDKSITSMTQAEKSMLRYHAIMTQVTEVQGDMARTLDSPANQTRIFKAQIDQLTRSIGNTLIPLINKLLPYMIALAQVAREAADSIAAFFGYSLPEVDFSSASASVGDISADLEDATSSAKELKRTLMGFDEINRLNDTSSGASSESTTGGMAFDIEPIDYEDIFLGDLKFETDKIKQELEQTIKEITAIISGAALVVGAILVFSGANIPKGIALMAAGAVGLSASVAMNWNATDENLRGTLQTITNIIAGFSLALGGILCFSGVQLPLGIALLAVGATSLVAASAMKWKESENAVDATIQQITMIVSGALLALGAMFLVTGSFMGLGIALLAAGAVGLVTSITLNSSKLSEDTKSTIQGITIILSGALLVLGAILTFSGVATGLGLALMAAGGVGLATAVSWDSSKVMESLRGVVEDIKELFEPLTKFFSDLWNEKITPIFTKIGEIAGDLISNPFETVMNGFLATAEWILNKPINAINGVLGEINKIPGVNLPKLDTITLPRFEKGGFPAEGQAFIARENGPELVGTIGRKTAVANNDQIVDGIYQGVYQAMRDAGTGNGGGQTVVVMLPNGDVLGEAFVDWHNGVVKQTGNTPLLV